MAQLERLLKMAEDELTEYSTDARKIEKLRRKIGLSVSATEQRQVKEALLATKQSSNIVTQIVEEQRQTVALPFWGIAGLGATTAAATFTSLWGHSPSRVRIPPIANQPAAANDNAFNPMTLLRDLTMAHSSVSMGAQCENLRWLLIVPQSNLIVRSHS